MSAMELVARESYVFQQERAARLERERDALAEAVRQVRELAQQAFQVLYPAAIGYHSGWNLDPNAVLAALAAVPSLDVTPEEGQ